MNNARGRTEFMPGPEVANKLFSTDPKKPGEMVELMNAAYPIKAGFRPDPTEIALEIADVVYYGRQPKISPFFQNQKQFIEGLGLTYGDALAFCCLKYTVRLEQLDHQETRKKEYQVMKRYLEERGPRSFLDYHLHGRITWLSTR